MRFNDAGKFNTKAFNSDKYFDMGDLAATVTNAVPGYTELVTNGTFETGDLTGWTSVGSGTGSATVTEGSKYAGSYGCEIDSGHTIGDNGHLISRTVDFAGARQLSFRYKIVTSDQGDGEAYFEVCIPGETNVIDATVGDWVYINLDVSESISNGSLVFIAAVDCTSDAGQIKVYVDDVSILSDVSDTPYVLTWELTHEKTVSNLPAATFLWTFPDLEETISNDAELTHSIFVNTTPIFTIDFDSGSSEITVGETVTGATSGATGTVLAVELSSGSWAGGDAAGTIQIQDADGLFEDDEELDGSVAGDDAATADGEATRVTSKIYDKSVWKGIDDAYWSASVLLHGYFSFTENANFRELMITMKDHSDTDQTVFYGYIPDQGLTYDKNEYTTKLDAYSHARNLVDQYIPEADRNTVTWVPSGSTGYTTFLEPSVVVTTLLGGSASWNTTTGIKPYSINTVTDWGTASIPQRGWVWGPETTRWQAIMEMCDYLGWTFDTYYDATNDWQAGAFCDLDDIDTYLGIPAAVTFTKTDTPKYVMSVKKEKRGTEKINRVRVQGKRNKRRLNFITGTVEFTADHVVVDGGTGATATIVSCTKTSGSWGSDAAGYLIISYDRTGDFVDGDTIIDQLGAAYGAAVMQGNSVIYEQYDMYEYSVEDTDVGYSDGNRPRERFFDLEEEYDSTSLIEAKAQAYYDLYNLDATPYTVVFRDRCDLRLWQKIKLVGWSDVPEDWMRIVYIKYTETNAGNVIVTVTLNNSDYVMGQRKMRRSLRNDDVNEIETIIKTWLKKNTAQVADTLKVEGEGVTVQFEPGGVNFIVRNPGGAD